MLNLNSPTVQAMISNTPQGFGNMPVYFGSQPTTTQTIEPATPQVNTPYPSPKEMLMQSGQNAIYAPTSFMPRNIVGAYNPGYQTAFAGYSNPYMGYGTYGGYGYNMMYPQFVAPPDEESRQILEMAQMNGLTYDEQLNTECDLLKKMSRIVSKNLERDEDEAKELEEAFSPYYKTLNSQEERKVIPPIHIQLKVGDDVVADMNPNTVSVKPHNYIQNRMLVESMAQRSEQIAAARIITQASMYDKAPERMFDHTDMIDFFNVGSGVIFADMLNKDLQLQYSTNATKLYDQTKFKKNLLENNGIRSKEQMKAVERFAGRYGVMPDGRPTTPGLDPSVATSFSYDPTTGQYHVTAPNFIRDRLERARESFIRSIDEK